MSFQYWMYIVAVALIPFEGVFGAPIISFGISLVLLEQRREWGKVLLLVLLSWWIAVSQGVSWAVVLVVFWLLSLGLQAQIWSSQRSLKFVALSLMGALVVAVRRPQLWSPQTIILSIVSTALLMVLSRLLYAKHSSSTSMARSLPRLELFKPR